MHGRRGEADLLRDRVVEMKRIVVARNARVSRQRLRVEGADDDLGEPVSDLDVDHAPPPNPARGTSRSMVSIRATGAPAVDATTASSVSRGGVSSRRIVTLTS